MAQYEEQNPLDYRAGGDTVDDFAQKYKKEIARIYQFLNNLREHNSTGPNQVEPQPYMFKVTDNKLFIRNSSNNAWLYLFDITYRMGMSDNPDAVILTSDDVTTTAEALKLVKTNSDGDIDADITGNAHKFGNKTADQYVTVDDVSDAGVALKIVKTDSEGVAHISISGSAAQLNGKVASYYLNEDDVAIVPAGTVTDAPNKLVKTNANGVLPVDILGNVGKMAGKNIEVNNLQDGQVFTYRSASNSWRNEDKGVVGAGKALAIYDGDTLLAEYSGDEPKSIDLANGMALRLHGYSIGSTAMLSMLPPSYYLECTTAGTTGANAPIITPPVSEGDTINDGAVVWTVRRAVCENDYSKRSFGASVINHLLGSTLASLVSAVSTDSLFSKLLKLALEAAGLRYSMGTNGYICLGSLFGDLILQWGREYFGGAGSVAGTITITYPIEFNGYFQHSTMLLPSPDGTQATISTCYGRINSNINSEYECIYKASNVGNGGTYIYWIATGR